MRKLIGKIRRQPKPRRENIAFAIAASFTFLVVTIWMFNTPNRFNGVLTTVDSSQNNEDGFFSTIGSQAAALKESLKETINVDDSATETESMKKLMEEYRASSAQGSSTQSVPINASSTATTSPKSVERFTTDSSYESETPREVRIQAVTKSTTSSTTSE